MPDDETRSPLELLYNVSRELASALDLRTVLQRILFQSLKFFEGPLEIVGAVILLVVLFVAYENIARILPASY